MKKLIALLLAMIMVCGLATTAFADDFVNNDNQPAFTPDQGTTFTKEYIVHSGKAPAEDFDFGTPELIKFVDQYENEATLPTTYPAVTLGKASFTSMEEGTYTAEATVTIDQESVKASALGVYTYKIEEVAGTNAGVSYVAEPVYLVVTVLRDEANEWHYVAAIHYEKPDGEKTAQTTNEYDSGSLTVTKQITGNMADMTKKFSFTITFNAPDDLIMNSAMKITVGNISGYELWTPCANSASYTNSIGDGESIVITNIPAGVTYTITEVKEDYTQSSVTGEEVTGEDEKTVSGTIEADDEDAAEFTNELKSNVDTGVALDSAPYIVMLVVAMVGMVALVAKKRYEV